MSNKEYKINNDSILNFPFYGTLVRGNKNGFSFISNPPNDYFIHISNNVGKRVQNMESLNGKECVFTIGASPFAYKNKKPRWESVVIQWMSLSEISNSNKKEISKEYIENIRKDSFEKINLDQFIVFLQADWYVKLWEKRANTIPKSHLQRDQIIEDTLIKKINECDTIDKIDRLFEIVSNSLWFPEKKSDILEKFFEPTNWHTQVLSTVDYLKSDSIVSKKYKTEIHRLMISNRSISIDLESNGKTIFQYGWFCDEDRGLINEDKGLKLNQLKDSINKSIIKNEKDIIVGHNIIKWDIPIIEKHKVDLSENRSFWDTLIISWLLEPWKSTHALINKNNAHRADSDAKECYNLFLKQMMALEPILFAEEQTKSSNDNFRIKPFDTQSLIEHIFLNPELISNIKIDYNKSEFGDLLSKYKEHDIVIMPDHHLNKIGWVKGISINIHDPSIKSSNPILDYDICKIIAEKQDDLFLKLISIAVYVASKNGIKIFFSMLPAWILSKIDCKSDIIRQHAKSKSIKNKNDSIDCLLFNDLLKMDSTKQSRILSKKKIAIFSRYKFSSLWYNDSKTKIKEKDILQKFPEIKSQIKGKTLFRVSNDNKISWVFYENPGLKNIESSWKILPQLPSWFNKIKEYPLDDVESNLKLSVPNWMDGETSNLNLDRIFVSPFTQNRKLYLHDLNERVLNLINSVDNNDTLIISTKWSSEADMLQSNLVKLGFSTNYSDSPLRQLEHIKNKNYKGLACSYDDVYKYVSAADELNFTITLVVDQIPIHEWYAAANTIESSQDDILFEKIKIKNKDIVDLTKNNINGWLNQLFQYAGIDNLNTYIIDSTITSNAYIDIPGLKKIETPFFQMQEVLDKDQYKIFEEICFPEENNLSIPNDYISYKNFLKENWGYSDFRKGTQKPAIEKIITTTKDIILRLPTGAGKSIIFHLPALFRSSYSKKLTIVITPLRALMKDQVDGLRERNFHESVDYLSGGREAVMNYEVYQGVLDGRIKLLFVAPERFRVEKFIDVIERRRLMDSGLEFIVFDEAHCISEWGFEFRPDYLFASRYVAENFKKNDFPGNPHRLLLTSATITERNRLDIENELTLGKKNNYHLLPDNMPHPIQSYIKLKSFDLNEDEEAPLDEKGAKIIEILSKLDLTKSAALIFVRRRKDCHRISDFLNSVASEKKSPIIDLNSLPFHAGLPESIKSESVELLKNNDINVLVCTKAFGMGMDIPHIHASIHHRPTTYIEDFLQEVGRIGRDEESRKRSKIKQVEGSVLFNSGNIDGNLSSVHDEKISHLDLEEFFEYVKSNAVVFEEANKSVCIIDSKIQIHREKEYNETQVSNILFWLERMRAINIEGRHPPVLKLKVDLALLENIAGDESLSSRVGLALIENIRGPDSLINKLKNAAKIKKSKIDGNTLFNRVVKGILGGVVSLIDNPNNNKDLSLTGELIEINISIQKLIADSGEMTRDELFTALIDLGKSEAVKIVKSFSISVQNGKSDNSFYRLLNQSIDMLLNAPSGKIYTLKRKVFEHKLKEWYRADIIALTKNSELSKFEVRKINREVIRVINTSLRLFRYLGIELNEKINQNGEPIYNYLIPISINTRIKSKIDEIIDRIRRMCHLFDDVKRREATEQDNDAFKIELEELLIHFDDEGLTFSNLMEIIKLVESSGFYAFNNSLDDWVTIISFEPDKELEKFDITEKSKSKIQKIYIEMNTKYELQQLRAQCMVMLLAMPEKDRRDFIDKYFESRDIKNLQKLLEDTIGNISDDFISDNIHLNELLGKVRRERFTIEMKRLNPNQKKIVETIFDKNILVNAGPGSGKTHVLMMRCAHLIHNQKLEPSEILVLAFNRAVVFEIKDRIAKLFREIGYGSYADKLKVYTFHSFALQHVESESEYEENAINDALRSLAERVKEEQFISEISSKYKAILIDEFQDMNEDFFTVIKQLIYHIGEAKSRRGGGMVIGDDDQDILMWNRIQWGKQNKHNDYPLHAVRYFEQFEKYFNPTKIELNLNYRSSKSIIQRANKMIEKVEGQLNINRMKLNQLQPFRKEDGYEGRFNKNDFHDILKEKIEKKDSIALLSRSNSECREIYDDLITNNVIIEDRLDLLGSIDLKLYQRRECGALIDICKKRNEFDFVEEYVWDEIIDEYIDKNHAQVNHGVDYLNSIYFLIKQEVGRVKIRDIQNFLGQMNSSDIDRLLIKTKKNINHKVKISTIHKVKGLEFETVFVMPSKMSFPLRGNNISILNHAAEEARLYFVAMTRAKNSLYMSWDERENHWYNGKSYMPNKNGQQFLLKGDPSEFFVSWPGRDYGLQNFIEKNVSAHDIVSLKNGKFLFDSKEITSLKSSNVSKVKPQNKFRVSNVMRYSCGEYFRQKNANLYDSLCQQVKDRGWFYLPLIEQL